MSDRTYAQDRDRDGARAVQGPGTCVPWEEHEELRQAAIELLRHPRSSRAALDLYTVLDLNPFTIRTETP